MPASRTLLLVLDLIRAGSCGSARLALVIAVVGLQACGSERQLAGPADPDGSGAFTLTVRALVAEQDAELAAEPGWQDGVPGAELFLLRHGTATYNTFSTDETGRVEIPSTTRGVYRVYAKRKLTTTEASGLSGPVRAFGDGTTVTLTGTRTVELRLQADRAGGLVISEIHSMGPPPWETVSLAHHYFEVYNNSDQLQFLDSRLFARGYWFATFDYDHTPCTVSRPIREDPTGLYTRQGLVFPGTGGQYPIGPGETRLVATAAIDHRPIHPDLPDLSHSDFEIAPSGGPDNPAVPNMIHVGDEPWPNAFSPLIATSDTYFLAEAVDLDALPIAARDHQGQGYVRVPADLITDAVSFVRLWPDRDRERVPCNPKVHERFDRYETAILEIGFGVEVPRDQSYQRIPLRTEGGITVLTDTNTSAADFVLGLRTPRRLP